jgi:xanthine dehydrogenase small subunit
VAPISFLLNGAAHAAEHTPPTTTVLDYVRTVAGLTGTKEGCAEGDCGACTILVARPQTGTLAYRAVNSCLMMLPQLDGAVVRTVEGVTPPGAALHPVQQALVEADATQCGFCTPGFVMAMVAFNLGGEPPRDDLIHEALAGNLCRCTGYRPIVEACRRAAELSGANAAAAALDDSLAPVLPSPCSEYRHGSQIFLAPGSLEELAEATAQHPTAHLLGGGTDLGILVSKEREALPVVISTARVPQLKRIVEGPDALELGGAVTYSEALPRLDAHFPAFAALVRRIGSRQIRNLGTLAGNLATASPIGDTLPCLMALEATVALRSRAGARSMPVEQFILGYRKTALQPGEFIEAIRIPRLASGQQFFTYKVSKRFDQDISTVIGAFRLLVRNGMVQDLRAAYGGMASAAKHAALVEQSLIGKPWTEAALANAAQAIARDFGPISDHRGGAAYRLRCAANLLHRLHLETTGAALARVELI